MIEVIKYPEKALWLALTTRASVLTSAIQKTVVTIVESVQSLGDQALFDYTLQFDQVKLERLTVGEEEFKSAKNLIGFSQMEAIKLAKRNIEKFHAAFCEQPQKIETTKGVFCWRDSRPIERVGLYIPGGSAPLFSSVLMLGIPALLAGCKEIILCTPPNKEGKVDPLILYTAELLGIKNIFKVGGAQAVGAMAYGTESITKVDKIFGPGNQYVTLAKMLVQMDGIAIDMPAGPSEVLVVADRTSNAKYVASDLLAQAEHGEDSQVILLSNDLSIIERINQEIKVQLESLPRQLIVKKALQNSRAILLENIDQCIEFSNCYAPEHLILAFNNSASYEAKIQNAGSVFFGRYSCESIGDYASGTNHTLPTGGFAKSYSGVSVDSFVKKVTFQHVTRGGFLNIGKSVEVMAEAEHLVAHKQSISLRLNDLIND